MKRKLLYTIAELLRFVPDTIILRIYYVIKMHRWLHLYHPKRYSEAIQAYKAFYRNKDMLPCVDKYSVRQYVTDKLGTDKYLVPLYQVCDNASLINFNTLPNQFVIKTTDGGDGKNVLICRDKSKLNIQKCVQEVNSWRNKRYDIISREWAYKGARQSKVIVEQLLESDENSDGSIDDYKFLCFDGKFKYLWIDKDRFTNHRRGFWDKDFNFMPHVSSDKPTFTEGEEPVLPANIGKMRNVAERLASGFPFARIDLYNINGGVFFGEITFYPWSGFIQYHPDAFDFELGKHFNLDFIKTR